MSARFFLDTNIFVYTFDPREPEKQARATDLVETALRDQSGVISSQVVRELLNVATRKFERPLEPDDARDYLEAVLAPLCEIFPSISLYRDSLAVAARWRYSFYDSLIIAAAKNASCKVLYSEDLQHGQDLDGLLIENPFVDT